jgi:hypothetical protein
MGMRIDEAWHHDLAGGFDGPARPVFGCDLGLTFDGRDFVTQDRNSAVLNDFELAIHGDDCSAPDYEIDGLSGIQPMGQTSRLEKDNQSQGSDMISQATPPQFFDSAGKSTY